MSESIQFPRKEGAPAGVVDVSHQHEQNGQVPLMQLLDRKFVLLQDTSIPYTDKISGLLELSKEYLAIGDMEKAKEVLAYSETIENQTPSSPEAATPAEEKHVVKINPSTLFA